MLRALDLDTQDHPLSASYKRNKFVVSIRRENRSKMFTSLRKMQDTQEEKEGQRREKEEGTDRVLNKEYREDIVRFNKKEVKEEDFELLEKMMDSEQPLQQLQGIIGIRKLVDSSCFPLDLHVKSQTIDKLLSLLEDASLLQVKYQATCIFSSIASNQTPLNEYITSCKCIPTFLSLLKLNHHFATQVMWFFSNMIVDTTIFRNQLINQGVTSILVDLLDTIKDKEVDKIVALTMANLCRGDPLPQYDKIKEVMVSLCFALAQGRISDVEEFKECLWGISYHVNVRKAEIAKIIESNICLKCIEILSTEEYHQEDKLILPCSRIVSRLSEGGVKIVQYLLDNSVLDALEKMLYHESVVIRRQACLSVSNIAASSYQHINILLQNDCLINRLKEMMERDEIHVRYEIAAIFCNMCIHRQLDIDVLIIQLEIVECFKELLTSPHQQKVLSFMGMLQLPLRLSQQKITNKDKESLLALEMHRKGVLSILEVLQYHQNQAIYDAASKLLHRYFRSFMDDPLASGPLGDQPSQALKSL